MQAWTRWLLVLLGLLIAGCAKQEMIAPEAPAAPEEVAPQQLSASGSAREAPAPEPSAASTIKSSEPETAAAKAKAGDGKDEPLDRPNAKPLLIYEAQLHMRVEHDGMPSAIESIIDIAESRGGYLVARSDDGVTVRIPSESLRDALADVAKHGEVLRRSVSAQDVSEQYHDLEVRLRSLEAVRDRLEQFLARAANVTEAMAIAKQLDTVGQEIDQVKGRMKFLSTRAAYSLITVRLEEKPEVVVAQPTPPSAPPAPRPVRLPVPWLHDVGLDSLTRLPAED